MGSILYSSFALTFLAASSAFVDGRRLHKRECVFTWPATDGDTCATMSRDWALNEAQFQAMNSGVDCSKLVPNTEYCVEWSGPLPSVAVTTPAPTPTPTKASSTTLVTKASSAIPDGPAMPSPVQSGVAQNCQKWYLVVSGDTCQKIVDTYKTFNLAQFYQWNPAVGTSCAQLQADTFVCVGVPGTPTAAPTPTTTTKPSSPSSPPSPPTQIEKPCRWIPSKGQYQCPGEWPPAPGPTQAGITPCTKWVLQKDGVYCADMAKAAGITLSQFYSWNPAVGTNCGGLWAGYAYCVGVV